MRAVFPLIVVALLAAIGYVIVLVAVRRWERGKCPVCLNGGSPIDYPVRTGDGLQLCRKHAAQRHHIVHMEQNLKEMP